MIEKNKDLIMPLNEKQIKILLLQKERNQLLSEKISHWHLAGALSNIEQSRDLIKHLILVASATIALSIPILDKSSLIKNNTLLIVSLSSFFLFIFFAYLRLVFIIQKEGNSLEELRKKYFKIINESNELINKSLNTKNTDDFQKFLNHQDKILNLTKQSIKDDIEGKGDRDYSLDLLFILFSLSLFLLILSITPWINKFIPSRYFY